MTGREDQEGHVHIQLTNPTPPTSQLDSSRRAPWSHDSQALAPTDAVQRERLERAGGGLDLRVNGRPQHRQQVRTRTCRRRLGAPTTSPTHHFQPYIYTSWTRIAAALLEQLGSRRTGQDVEVRTLALSTRLPSMFLQPPTHSPPQNPITPNRNMSAIGWGGTTPSKGCTNGTRTPSTRSYAGAVALCGHRSLSAPSSKLRKTTRRCTGE